MSCLLEFFWNKPKAKVFYIEGNEGVGKTETMYEIAEFLRERGVTVSCLPQHVEQWVTKGYMEAMQTDKGAQHFAAFATLQDYAVRESFIATHNTLYDVILVERHASTTLDVFDKSMEVHNLFAAVNSISDFLHNPSRTIYLKNTPAVCYTRTQRRARSTDMAFDEETFIEMNKAHEDMITKRKALGGEILESDALGADSHHHLIKSIATSMGYHLTVPV